MNIHTASHPRRLSVAVLGLSLVTSIGLGLHLAPLTSPNAATPAKATLAAQVKTVASVSSASTPQAWQACLARHRVIVPLGDIDVDNGWVTIKPGSSAPAFVGALNACRQELTKP